MKSKTTLTTKQIQDRFFILMIQASPENASCDGERSRKETAEVYKKIKEEWTSLEKQFGRKVTELEATQWKDYNLA